MENPQDTTKILHAMENLKSILLQEGRWLLPCPWAMILRWIDYFKLGKCDLQNSTT